MTDHQDNRGKLVCVTGASGYIGTHVVRELLQRGYRVRGTVRDTEDREKTAHLLKIAEDTGQPLELISANLMIDGAFDPVFEDCEYICHLATAVRLTAKDPQKEIVDVALQGTENALRSAARAGTVKRFVMTSSVAAIFNTKPQPGHVYTEADWVQDASLQNSPYPLAKMLSEREAYDFANQQSASFDVVTINPAFVVGPVYTRAHLRSSPTLLVDIFTGKFPLCPRFSFGVVDVRDVADAHVNALERADVSGRHLLHCDSMWVKEMAQVLRQAFPERKSIPRHNMPDLAMYAYSLFDKRLNFSFLRRNLGKRHQVNNQKSIRELGINYRDKRQSIVDTCQSMLDHKLTD